MYKKSFISAVAFNKLFYNSDASELVTVRLIEIKATDSGERTSARNELFNDLIWPNVDPNSFLVFHPIRRSKATRVPIGQIVDQY